MGGDSIFQHPCFFCVFLAASVDMGLSENKGPPNLTVDHHFPIKTAMGVFLHRRHSPAQAAMAVPNFTVAVPSVLTQLYDTTILRCLVYLVKAMAS